MLSRAAEAALLKTLEEPPPHVVFVLATTDPQKVSPTIRSRTQHLEFHLLPADELESHVRWVAADAGLQRERRGDRGGAAHGRRIGPGHALGVGPGGGGGGVTPELVPLDDLVEGLVETDPGGHWRLSPPHPFGTIPRSLAEELIAHLATASSPWWRPSWSSCRIAGGRSWPIRRSGSGSRGRSGRWRCSAKCSWSCATPPTRVLLDVALVKLTNIDADSSPSASSPASRSWNEHWPPPRPAAARHHWPNRRRPPRARAPPGPARQRRPRRDSGDRADDGTGASPSSPEPPPPPAAPAPAAESGAPGPARAGAGRTVTN